MSSWYNYPAPLYSDRDGYIYKKSIEDLNKRTHEEPNAVDSATDLFALIFFRPAQHIDFCTFLNDRGYLCNGAQSSNFAFAVAWFLDDTLQKYFFGGALGKGQAESKPEEDTDGERSEAAIQPVITATYPIFSPKDPGHRPKPRSNPDNAEADCTTAFVKENAFESLTNKEARHLYDLTIYYIAQLTKPSGKFPFKIKLRSDEKRVLVPWKKAEECDDVGDGSGSELDDDDDNDVCSRATSQEL